VARVRSLDELADTCELLAAGRRAFPGGLAAIHDSGGERAHLVDLAEELGVPLARISAATRSRLAAVLEPGCPPPTRWTPGAPATTPTRSSPPASARCSGTPTPGRWRSPWT
jgi:hypothetical protein